MELKTIYEDENLLVVDKPAGVNSDDFEKRVHRLDKDTSGILLIAKNNKTLNFLQKQFQTRNVIKKYIALVINELKADQGIIKTLIARSPKNRKKQAAFLFQGPQAKKQGPREAITEYKVIKQFKNYTLVEVQPKTGRKHQIRCHFAYLGHPIAGDKLYGFKNQPCPKELNRQFLHASYLKIKLPDGTAKEFRSTLPRELEKILSKLNPRSKTVLNLEF